MAIPRRLSVGIAASIFTLALLFSPAAFCTVLVHDDFSGSSGTNLAGTTPDTNTFGGNWLTNNASANLVEADGTVQFLGSGAASASLQSIDMGSTSYMSTNPGIYQLSLDVTRTGVSTLSWIGLGFSKTIGSSASNFAAGSGDTVGNPWMLIRANGNVNVYAGPAGSGGAGTSNQLVDAAGPFAGTVNLQLILDTTGAMWGYDVKVNGVNLDLNGGSAGTTAFINPRSVQYVGFATGHNTANTSFTVDNFLFEVVPEPGAVTLLGIALGVLVLRRRR